MQKLTPYWNEICHSLITMLDDLSDDAYFLLERGEDPMSVALNTTAELRLLIDAIENDPGQFSPKDAS